MHVYIESGTGLFHCYQACFIIIGKPIGNCIFGLFNVMSACCSFVFISVRNFPLSQSARSCEHKAELCDKSHLIVHFSNYLHCY